MPNVRLRPAHPGDLDLLRRWDEQPHVLASDPNEDWAWETELARNPPWREQLIGEVDGRPVGFLQMIDPSVEESRPTQASAQPISAKEVFLAVTDVPRTLHQFMTILEDYFGPRHHKPGK